MSINQIGRLIVVVLAASGFAAGATAQVVPLPPDLGQSTLEDLMKIRITSASYNEQRTDEAPAAVSVMICRRVMVS